jgi:hypothetical protein
MELITLGDKKLPVVAQRHARLRHYLSKTDFSVLMSAQYGPESYKLLSVLVPTLPETMPEWEWNGYASAEAEKVGDYVESSDRSPTTEEIVVAFETVLKVNGAGRLGKIMDLVKMGMRQAERNEVQTQMMPSSPASAGANGEST